MELPTYTSIFTLRRKLYALYDWELPRPLELVQVGVFVVAALAVWLITRAIGVGFSASTGWAFVVPPAALAWYTTQPIADGKGLGPWLGAQFRYLLEPRALASPSPAPGQERGQEPGRELGHEPSKQPGQELGHGGGEAREQA